MLVSDTYDSKYFWFVPEIWKYGFRGLSFYVIWEFFPKNAHIRQIHVSWQNTCKRTSWYRVEVLAMLDCINRKAFWVFYVLPGWGHVRPALKSWLHYKVSYTKRLGEPLQDVKRTVYKHFWGYNLFPLSVPFFSFKIPVLPITYVHKKSHILEGKERTITY